MSKGSGGGGTGGRNGLVKQGWMVARSRLRQMPGLLLSKFTPGHVDAGIHGEFSNEEIKFLSGELKNFDKLNGFQQGRELDRVRIEFNKKFK